MDAPAPDPHWPFVKFVKRSKPIDPQAEAAAADERDAAAIVKFLNVVLNGTLKPSCNRVGSSQVAARKGKKR